MALRLDGKVAVVTGASRGIGASIAETLGERGAAVVVNYVHNRKAAEGVVERIRAKGGRAEAVQADMAQRGQVKALFDAAEKAFGGVDVLVNNAGVFAAAPLESIDDEHIHRQFDVNVRGVLYATQEAAARFGERGGRIVNVSSVVAERGFPGTAVYSASKGAVDTLTSTLAVELGPRGITVNAVAPGPVQTDMYVENGLDQMADGLTAQTPLRRIGQPQDVAGAVAFLVSEEARWVTGQVVQTSGGFRA